MGTKGVYNMRKTDSALKDRVSFFAICYFAEQIIDLPGVDRRYAGRFVCEYRSDHELQRSFLHLHSFLRQDSRYILPLSFLILQYK